MQSQYLDVFTDGACSNNGKKNAVAAYACVWPDHPEMNEGHLVPSSEPQTNNRAEYKALHHALIQAYNLDKTFTKHLRVFTDSQLMVNSFTKWIHGWKQKQWRKADGQPVANLDLVKEIDEYMTHRQVIFKHVRAHTGGKSWEAVWNDKVDRLARDMVESHMKI
jgi:ribonuclease HI